MHRLTIAALAAACSAVSLQAGADWILAARRSGAVELIEPSTLATVSRIHIDLPPKSVGINGVVASADGSMLYVEGPIPLEPMGCCYLYAVDLTTLEMRVAASIPGSASRKAVTPYASSTINRRVADGTSGCTDRYVEASLAAGGSVFRYEEFGFKLDRRIRCGNAVSGGATVWDAGSGRQVRQIAPDLHFAELISNAACSQLYGVATEDPGWNGLVRLVRIDSRDGGVRMSRALEADFWRISTAPLDAIPAGDVEVSLRH